MSLSEQTVLHSITIDHAHCISVLRQHIIMRGTEEIARSNHRATYQPGDDISAEPEHVCSIAKLVWTDEVVTAHRERLAKAVAESNQKILAKATADNNVAIGAGALLLTN